MGGVIIIPLLTPSWHVREQRYCQHVEGTFQERPEQEIFPRSIRRTETPINFLVYLQVGLGSI
jgi:hypothetical protein